MKEIIKAIRRDEIINLIDDEELKIDFEKKIALLDKSNGKLDRYT